MPTRSLLFLLFCLLSAPALAAAEAAQGTNPSATRAPAADPALAAWSDFCRRLEAVGARMIEEDFPQDDAARAEGFRHLARVAAMALQWEIDVADTDFPMLYRQNDEHTKWGGPNVDNSYLRARIDGTSTYRLRGQVKEVHDLIVSTRTGDMHQQKFGVAGDLDSSELDIDADGRFTLAIGPDVDPAEGIRTTPDTDHVGIRQYFVDWANESPGTFHLERVSPGPALPAALTTEQIVERLDAAARWVEQVIVFWNQFLARSAASTPENGFAPPRAVGGGSEDIAYGGGRFDLEEDQALLIEMTPPEARYWSLQWYTPSWFESPDFANRQTSLNNGQARVDADGKVRMVVSAKDPGIENWIDTAGHARGHLTYRYVWTKNRPTPNARLVALDELRSLLPADTPHFDAAARAAQIAIRRTHVERRFRR